MPNWFEVSRVHLMAPEDCLWGSCGREGLCFPFQLLGRLHAQINQLPPRALKGFVCLQSLVFPQWQKMAVFLLTLTWELLSYSPFAVLSKHTALHTVVRLHTVPWGKFSWPKTKKGQPKRELSPCWVQKLFYCLVTLAKAFQKGPVMRAANPSDSRGGRFSRNPN